MELEILEKEKTKMKVKVIGEGHSFCNALRNKLHEDSAVLTAAYEIKHPLISDPIIHLRVSEGEAPEEVLNRVVGKLAEDYEEIQEKLEKELKN